jgi:hypothetical protein
MITNKNMNKIMIIKKKVGMHATTKWEDYF